MKVSLGHELPQPARLVTGGYRRAGRPSSTVPLPPLPLFMSLLEQTKRTWNPSTQRLRRGGGAEWGWRRDTESRRPNLK